ncbi:NAD(P)/FAD-dependent oxidoreductase [Streptomyces sp. NPDC056161]|uniref:NAD(P)/FAD-dependent oxidoreductase n=1 Tax=Streptomyces sp. NPDC056161 TaxID=3345732 RepID=UPI0035DF3EEE
MRAVQAVRRDGYCGRIVLIGREPTFPYDRPPLSKSFLTKPDAGPLFYADETELAALDVELRLGSEATGLDLASRTVQVDGAPVTYDKLIVATGADPRPLVGTPPLAGAETLRTLHDANRVRDAMRHARNVVIVGAGFIGAEVASSVRQLGAKVTIVEATATPLVRAVGETGVDALSRLHDRRGVRLLRGTSLEKTSGDTHVTAVTLSNGETLETDLLIVGVGASPATGWLRDSGLVLHPADGGLVCDAQLRTSDEHVYAAGDIVHWPNAVMDTTMRLENWTNAAEQGARAALNAVFPERAQPDETVPYCWSDWYGHRIQFVGTADAESVTFADGSPDDDQLTALYRTGDRAVGAATLNRPRLIMKLRRLIATPGSWDDALALVQAKIGSTR